MWHHRLQRRIRFSYWNELCVTKNKEGASLPFVIHRSAQKRSVFTTSSNGSLPMRG